VFLFKEGVRVRRRKQFIISIDRVGFTIVSVFIFFTLSVSLLYSREKGTLSEGEKELNRGRLSKGINPDIEWLGFNGEKEEKAGSEKMAISIKKSPAESMDDNRKTENEQGEGQSKTLGMTPGLNLGFTFPSFAYGKRYKNTPGFSAGTRFERYRFYGLVPEVLFRYSNLESRDREGKVDSSISLSQFSLGARYNYRTKLPLLLSRYSFFRSPVTLYARASEGITRVSFTSDRVGPPLVEYINTIELSAGFTYPVYNAVEAGLDFGYRYIAMKEVPFQAFYLMVVFGVRV
jgi:hypothetical protein